MNKISRSVLVLVTLENNVNSYSDHLKLGGVCEFRVEFDKIPLRWVGGVGIGPIFC